MATAVVLKMELHCRRCVGRIRKLIRSLHAAPACSVSAGVCGEFTCLMCVRDDAGVQDVWVSLETGLVVVAGPFLDASLLRWRIQYMTGKPVEVVSDGAPEEPSPDNGQMVHLGPPQTGYGGYPYGGYYYGGGGWVPEYHARRQYVPNEAPVCFNDDNPNGCCVMQ
ncbi:hypothetical protein SETIT_5G457100v2 [Setaria italica]|uniref:HMA domain-containing protein n=1 Tax=Setaria italica TaxID=4555 RepID=A0A368RGA9_SETIT|nr:hypothetical protein SETIT_5G457100v2 [Setaria italica]